MISLIVAMDQNRLIGKENDLPWRLPEDLKYFKRITTSHTIVMGRKTFESIGRPLPNRENVVLTRQKDYQQEGATVIHSVEELEALDAEKEDELFVIGGATLYEQTLDVANRLYITHIEESFEGDTHFPAVNLSEWRVISKQQGIKDEKNPYTYYFTVYERS
ncbi:dihydrofolate reductase [Priestia megaterium]|uniref:Dihydrofolate reductase n=2 Tax=Priestia TaxID=2800373 RepID=A0AAX6N8Y8_PRIAR|nr:MULTISPECIES: dihydrofolate reductase [Priestia]MBU8851188.1 dihydrofolate reductase [Bacillus sp. FJAT-26377]AEN88050.1 Dihydrofolate reductase region [Priestia megaterium WSH-002]MDU9692361.1 dihydrofolate reductase [Priestia aryabhattai]MED5246259.1 dihydrofolate reductase [Priestia sp. LL-8]PVC71187.1 dihydrofolate reductase [Priestia megaterium]